MTIREHFGDSDASGRSREDRQLNTVVRARDGDLDAFESLVKEHTARVYRLAAAMVGESAAGDVVQDAFVLAWQQLPRLRDPERFAPWLHRIAVNRCRQLMRSSHVVREIPTSAVDIGAVPAPGDFRQAADARAAVAPAFRRLSTEHRAVIALHYAAGLSLREVAEALDIPTGTAKSRLNAALRALRQGIGGIGND